MESPIDCHREELVGVCQRHRVSRLDLVGSAARGDFNPATSDLDFMVEFLELEDGAYADAYFGLQEELETLLGRHVDLIMGATVRNPFLVRSLDRHRVVLYAA